MAQRKMPGGGGFTDQNRDSFGLPGWTLHQFRHQFATNLAASDVHPKVMQQLLGHTTPVLTLQVYTHAHAGQGIEAIGAMDELKQAQLRDGCVRSIAQIAVYKITNCRAHLLK